MTSWSQVVELPRERPDPALELFWDVPDLRILVVGGDGTVGWILSCLDAIEHGKDGGAATGWQQPPIAMLPLGTGPLLGSPCRTLLSVLGSPPGRITA